MKRLKKELCVFAVLIMIIASTACNHESAEGNVENNYDFRCGKWGDDIETIKETDDEINQITKDWSDEFLMGDTIFSDCKTSFSYYFVDKKLFAGQYKLNPEFIDKDSFHALYENILEGLKTEYKEPSKFEDWGGSNLKEGEFSYYYLFETEISDVAFFFDNIGFEIGTEPHIEIVWMSAEYTDSIEN